MFVAADWRGRALALLSRPGSTRSVALIRIGLALVLWTTWGDDMVLFRSLAPASMAVALAFFVSTTLMAVGFWARLSTLIAGLSCWLIYDGGLIGAGTAFRHHHTALMTVAALLLALTPCGRSLSVDRWLALRRARRRGVPAPPELGDLWALRLLGVAASAVYLGAVVSKLTPGWLSGDRFEMLLLHYYLGSDSALPWWLARGLQLMTLYVVALEASLCLGLWWAPARRWLLPQGILMHWMFYVLLPVASFSLTMVLLYLAFVPPEAVHRACETLLAAPAQRTSSASDSRTSSPIDWQ